MSEQEEHQLLKNASQLLNHSDSYAGDWPASQSFAVRAQACVALATEMRVRRFAEAQLVADKAAVLEQQRSNEHILNRIENRDGQNKINESILEQLQRMSAGEKKKPKPGYKTWVADEDAKAEEHSLATEHFSKKD